MDRIFCFVSNVGIVNGRTNGGTSGLQQFRKLTGKRIGYDGLEVRPITKSQPLRSPFGI